MRFILASGSPARLATLRAAGVEPEVIVSGVDEDSVRSTSSAGLVRALAEIKARAVAGDLGGVAVVLGCDSLLELDGQTLGKPASAADATSRWRAMRGRTGTLHTGHALLQLLDGEVIAHQVESASASVAFADVTDAEIELYVGTGEPLGVAGAFTIDGLGGWFVESISGDHHNVVGLSLPLLRRMLAGFGLALADIGYPVGRQ